MKTDRYTTEQVITAIKETKGMLTIAAERLKCHPETVRTYVNRYPTVKAALQEQREGVLDVAELALMRAVQNGEGWAVCFTLKTIGKNRGYVERQEHTGADGGAIGIQFVDYRNNLAQTPGRSTEDSDPSGES